MSTTSRACMFCGVPADSMEHVFPDWLAPVLADVLSQDSMEFSHLVLRDGEMVTERRYFTDSPANQRVRAVCSGCNHGWMSDLETTAKPFLEPMIRGEPATLRMAEELTVAAWTIKTAMVAEALMDGVTSFTAADRELLRSQQQPPFRFRVNAAKFSLDQPSATRFSHGTGVGIRNGEEAADVTVHVLQIGHLVLSARAVMPRVSAKNVALESMPNQTPFEIPIFPPIEVFRWPPHHALNTLELEEYCGANNLPLAQTDETSDARS